MIILSGCLILLCISLRSLRGSFMTCENMAGDRHPLPVDPVKEDVYFRRLRMLDQPYAGICFRAQGRMIIHHKTKRERSTMGKKIVTITVLELIAELGKFPL